MLAVEHAINSLKRKSWFSAKAWPVVIMAILLLTGQLPANAQVKLQSSNVYHGKEDTSPAITAKTMDNIMGYVGDEPIVVDLKDYFDIIGTGTTVFQVSVNSEPAIAALEIENKMATISFLTPGQTNIQILGTHKDAEAKVAFVVGAMPHVEGDYVLADLDNMSLDPDSFWNGSDESGGFSSGLSFFPNSYNPAWGAWSGWAYSNISDNTTAGWSNQYSAITGVAIDNADDNPGVYAISYVSSPGTVLKFNNPSAHEVKGMFVSNTTYAALSMMYGDDFSKKFGGETGDDPDWFKLTITGMKNGEETETLDYYLADYRFEDNSKNYIVQTWQWVELSSLGKADSLMFTLSSSDMGDWGMNTPAYFAANNIFVVPDLSPIVSIPIEDITVDANADDWVSDLSHVFTDPDDYDEEIRLSVIDNTNPELVQTQLDDFQLTLSFTQAKVGEAEITLEAVSNGKTVTETFTVTVLSGTGIANNNGISFAVYPNPSSGIFSVVHQGSEEAILTLLNTSGQVVYRNQIYPGTIPINITELPAGIYMVKVQNDTERVTTRIIKQ